METELNKEKIIRYWVNSSSEDYETMLVLYHSQRYSWALFIGHLMIEKLLKAFFVQEKGSYPPYIHNLLRLSEKAGISINESQKVDLATNTAFNINARYDDYKMSFQKKCTQDFTDLWIINSTRIMDKETNQNIIKFISSVAVSYPQFVKAYLFGSFARHLNHPDSDIDIALVFESLADEEKLIYKFNCCCLPPDTIHVLNHILFRVMI